MVSVEENMGLAKMIAWKMYQKVGRKYAFEDILSCAHLGLVKAAKRFDESKGFKFSSYASITIEGEIRNHIRNSKWYSGDRTKTFEVADPISLDAFDDEELGPLINLIPQDFHGFEKFKLMDLITGTLNEKEIKLIDLSFFKVVKQKEIAKILGVTQVTVSRMRTATLKKIRAKIAI